MASVVFFFGGGGGVGGRGGFSWGWRWRRWRADRRATATKRALRAEVRSLSREMGEAVEKWRVAADELRDAKNEIERLRVLLKINEEALAQQVEINLRDRERVASETAMYSRRIAEYEQNRGE